MILWALVACGPTVAPDRPPPTCDDLMADGGPATDEAGLRQRLDAVHAALFPELDGVAIVLVPGEDPTSFFSANVEADSFGDPPLERTYTVVYSTLQFDDPPAGAAVTAILSHELGHIVDYTGMDATELASFALWYATSDVAAYERETDERALELGCADGLKAYRQWLYTRLDADAVAEKQRVYYTPAEIDAWVAAQGG